MKRLVILNLELREGVAHYKFPEILRPCIIPLTIKLHSAWIDDTNATAQLLEAKPILYFFAQESYNTTNKDLNGLGMMAAGGITMHHAPCDIRAPLVSFGQRNSMFVSRDHDGASVATDVKQGVLMIQLEGELSNIQLV